MSENAFMPTITKVSFPEGDLNFVYCYVSLDGQITYDSFIGIGVDVEDMTKASESLQLFDSYKVFTYVADLQDFFRVFIEGGADYNILSYEYDLPQDPLFDIDKWDEVKNDYAFWGKYDF